MSYSLYDYNVKVFFDKEDDDFVAAIDEICGCSAFGNTPEDALRELEIAYKAWLETVIESGYPIPKPFRTDEEIGKIELQMPESLCRQIIEQAMKDNMSVNQEIIHFLKLGLTLSKLSNPKKLQGS
ncbi:MAG: type II toxin-antitoxin system HicB family antitoxin [Candidatus Eremiobacteraeota bacterium]|nr:type II toxin-antitoxin system HicB family antitoxin [Candidatus Eremiobacteraeota bacterium]